jgi:hypothetical protein
VYSSTFSNAMLSLPLSFKGHAMGGAEHFFLFIVGLYPALGCRIKPSPCSAKRIRFAGLCYCFWQPAHRSSQHSLLFCVPVLQSVFASQCYAVASGNPRSHSLLHSLPFCAYQRVFPALCLPALFPVLGFPLNPSRVGLYTGICWVLHCICGL